VAKPRNALALLDGRLVASQQAGEICFHETLPPRLADEISRGLMVTTTVRNRFQSSVPSVQFSAADGPLKTEH
jgi:hypothetical protein